MNQTPDEMVLVDGPGLPIGDFIYFPPRASFWCILVSN